MPRAKRTSPSASRSRAAVPVPHAAAAGSYAAAAAPHAAAAASHAAAAAPHDAYPLKTVSRLTGLSADIIRAWEKRYAVVAPLRGPRGARLYSSGDVARLRVLGSLVAGGRSIGDVAPLGSDELAALAKGGEHAAPPSPAREQRIDDVLAALERFDAVAVERLLGESLVALGSARFVAEVGSPLLERIGALWEAGQLSVAAEHVASTTIRSLFGALIRLQMPARQPTFLLTTPSGERHELGVSMVTLLCLQAGLAAAYAGVDLPADEIVAVARRTNVRVIGLSVVSASNRELAVEELRRLEKELPRDVEIWLGGRDAESVSRQLSSSRVLVLQSLPAIEAEIERIARAELAGPAAKRSA